MLATRVRHHLLVDPTTIRLHALASTARCWYPPVNTGVYIWMPAGICGLMLLAPGRCIYHQMLRLPGGSGIGRFRGFQTAVLWRSTAVLTFCWPGFDGSPAC